jgi:hypothetical protein
VDVGVWKAKQVVVPKGYRQGAEDRRQEPACASAEPGDRSRLARFKGRFSSMPGMIPAYAAPRAVYDGRCHVILRCKESGSLWASADDDARNWGRAVCHHSPALSYSAVASAR